MQVKSAIGAATKTREEITKKLMDKLDQAARNLAKKDFEFDAFVFHTADEVDIVPDNGGRVLRAPLCPDEQAPWLEKLPAWVVSGKAFARHFPPSVLALMSLVAVGTEPGLNLGFCSISVRSVIAPCMHEFRTFTKCCGTEPCRATPANT